MIPEFERLLVAALFVGIMLAVNLVAGSQFLKVASFVLLLAGMAVLTYLAAVFVL